MKCLLRGTIIVALAGVTLACGQKGPLVLPDAPKHKRSVPALPGPKPATPAPPAPQPAASSPSSPQS